MGKRHYTSKNKKSRKQHERETRRLVKSNIKKGKINNALVDGQSKKSKKAEKWKKNKGQNSEIKIWDSSLKQNLGYLFGDFLDENNKEN